MSQTESSKTNKIVQWKFNKHTNPFLFFPLPALPSLFSSLSLFFPFPPFLSCPPPPLLFSVSLLSLHHSPPPKKKTTEFIVPCANFPEKPQPTHHRAHPKTPWRTNATKHLHVQFVFAITQAVTVHQLWIGGLVFFSRSNGFCANPRKNTPSTTIVCVADSPKCAKTRVSRAMRQTHFGKKQHVRASLFCGSRGRIQVMIKFSFPKRKHKWFNHPMQT